MTPYPYEKLEVTDENDKHWMVLCPFHNDTTPSMTINKGGKFPLWYRCWACGANGSPKKFAILTKQNPHLIEYVKKGEVKRPTIDWKKRLVGQCCWPIIEELAHFFKLEALTIGKFEIGYYGTVYKNYTTFLVPMFGSDAGICGIQEHWWAGDKHIKKCQKYSKHGIFKPNLKWDKTKPLFIAEGFTDTATLVELGFQAIGRYNALHLLNKKFIDHISQFTKVYIVSDNDEIGRSGAKKLWEKIDPSTIIYPKEGFKDIREMYIREGYEKTHAWITGGL